MYAFEIICAENRGYQFMSVFPKWTKGTSYLLLLAESYLLCVFQLTFYDSHSPLGLIRTLV